MKERSGCPIDLATELLGDRWSMVVLRDVSLGERRTFRDVLDNCLEGIATDILASRPRKSVAARHDRCAHNVFSAICIAATVGHILDR